MKDDIYMPSRREQDEIDTRNYLDQIENKQNNIIMDRLGLKGPERLLYTFELFKIKYADPIDLRSKEQIAQENLRVKKELDWCVSELKKSREEKNEK